MKTSILCYLRSQRGVTSIEYALIASLITVVIALAVGSVGEAVHNLFVFVSEQFPAGKP